MGAGAGSGCAFSISNLALCKCTSESSGDGSGVWALVTHMGLLVRPIPGHCGYLRSESAEGRSLSLPLTLSFIKTK